MKKLDILSGASGSGKSTLARAISDDASDSSVCSADDHFMVDGEYRFDPRQLGVAHAACLTKATKAMEAGTSVVILDNTNTAEWEFADYIKVAEANGYDVEIHRLVCNPATALARSIHGIPAKNHADQVRRLTEGFTPELEALVTEVAMD